MKESFELDPAHTVIGFSAKHLGVTAVRGHFAGFTGWFEADRDDLAGATGEVRVEIASIDTGEEQRDGHLQSADFFDAEKFPLMTFRMSGATAQGGDVYLVDGELTIKGITRPLQLRATFHGETENPFGSGSRIGIDAVGRVDRLEFGLAWDGLSGAVSFASHTIDIQIDTELIASPRAAKAAVQAAAGLGSMLENLSQPELIELRGALERVLVAVDRRLRTTQQPGAAAGQQQPAPEERPTGRWGRRS
ncbi:MAG TPA: YceI family protein [Candidatus Dormibacteraeota bacterium]|jgi:polyisoprenoid-binding protein YceI|nr:YceI family protein [Candidatus Dormibacteraeota bacterium]